MSEYLSRSVFSLDTNSHDQKNYIVNRVSKYISEHLNSHITLEDLASIFNMHPSYFSKIFKAETNLSPIAFVTNRKIEIARGLLDHTNKSISQIVDELGFFDANYFSRVFKQYTHYTPTEYRKRPR